MSNIRPKFGEERREVEREGDKQEGRQMGEGERKVCRWGTQTSAVVF